MNNKIEEMEEKLDKLTDKNPILIPFAVLENAMARAERREKRNFVVVVILVFAIVVSNIFCLNISQKGKVSQTVREDIARSNED